MMNTRSQTRARATDSASRDVAQERMGIRFRDEAHRDRFNRIKNREVKATKWACPIILNQLGISDDFNLLCNRAGLQNFVYNDVPTYRRLTIEFLSSLQSTVKLWQGEDTICFRLMNNNYNLTLDEWCACFNLPNNDVNALRASFTGLEPTPEQYYNGMSFTSRVNKGKNIQHPAIRYLFYVIANTL